MNRIIYNGTLLKSEATIGTEKITWSNIQGVLPPSETTSENPSDYTFTLNGVDYVCNYFLHGSTKFKASFRMEGHDVIVLEYIIETGLSNIIIRYTDVEVLDTNSFSLIEKVTPSDFTINPIHYANILFNKYCNLKMQINMDTMNVSLECVDEVDNKKYILNGTLVEESEV